ncbi:MAG: 16S rRNA (adenine(1518)-N(6)/adenine(1519)-N(6))-dimethyltransferase RsmA [Oceanococcus sp.]|nr:MAG: 16S rRNA (adenine(1518)-N(6)/adenine(1519)-N(6))-dimethyltransferase RsmA [Oceanococcus sp.]
MDKHRPRKRFGQNFLTDRNIIERIASAIRPSADQHLLEIGPGQAALTEALLPYCGKLTAVEIDRDLAATLRQRFAAEARFELIEADALKVDFATLGDAPLRVVGNLPYNISTPLVFHLLQSRARIIDFHIMLQREVAERMAAQPGSKTYGRLSVAVSLAARADILFDVPPGAFFPPPKVRSSIIRLTPRDVELPWRALDRVLQAAFSARRKTLRNALGKLFSAEQLQAHGLDPQLRPENLSPDQFLALATTLHQASAEAG